MNVAESNERLQVLKMIDQGIISAEEGHSLLQAMVGEQDEAQGILETPQKESPQIPGLDEIEQWKQDHPWIWQIPLWMGIGITMLSTGLMYLAWRTSGFGVWFAFTWLPFLLGVMVLILAWGSQQSPWLHVRIQQKPGETPEKIAISLPVPVRLTTWALRAFGHRLPDMEGVNLDAVILALNDSTRDETPFFVDVNDDDDGTRVQVIIA